MKNDDGDGGGVDDGSVGGSDGGGGFLMYLFINDFSP